MERVQRVAVLTSGGDAPGMNAAIRAVVRKGIACGLDMFGVEHGFLGLIKQEVKRMHLGSVADIIHRGGTILKTARCNDMFTPEGVARAAQTLKEISIHALVVIGGDGSYRGSQALHEHGIHVVGVPATIDNDIVGTDRTIGFDTAVNTAVGAISKIRDTASSHERAFLIEVMGRNCGDIALRAGLAIGAESLLIPEVEYDLEDVADKMLRGFKRGKNHSIIIVSEGAGDIWQIADTLRGLTGFDSRVTILGHIQRGGAPSAEDAVLAAAMGSKAVDAVTNNSREQETAISLMVAQDCNDIVLRPLADAFVGERGFDRGLYDLAGDLAI
ncbi:MAG: 6-phosphofructokinase [Peptococcaceae bacterium]|nr:6-phosphofructokinase [Peptococcaceae bacterium]